MHPLSSSSHMYFLKQYCQYEDPLKLVRSPCSRAQISVFVLGRCSPHPFKKVDCTYKASYAKVFSEFAKSARVSAPINPSEIKTPPPLPNPLCPAPQKISSMGGEGEFQMLSPCDGDQNRQCYPMLSLDFSHPVKSRW